MLKKPHRILVVKEVVLIHSVGRSLVELHAGRRVQARHIRKDAHLQLRKPPKTHRYVSTQITQLAAWCT